MESPAAHAREQQLKKLEEQTREANEKANVSTAFFDILKKNYESGPCKILPTAPCARARQMTEGDKSLRLYGNAPPRLLQAVRTQRQPG
jgi:hypothetical protein